MIILEVKNLTKHYKQVNAVNGISFQVKRGICFGLLGPNGAGKTTTIEMIEGLTQPTSGDILYKELPVTPQFKQEAGIQFQQTSLMDYLTVKETIEVFASFYQQSLPVDKISDICGLDDFLEQRATHISGGQRQRLLLALALVNDPEIVFLDEPTTGLDPQSRRNFWALIDTIKQQGKTVILTTHYMDEAELLCDELVILDEGRIIDQGTPKSLLNKHFDHVRITLDREDFKLSEDALEEETLFNDTTVTLYSDSVEKTIAKLIDHNVDLTSLSVSNPNLDDLFIKLTGHKLRQ